MKTKILVLLLLLPASAWGECVAIKGYAVMSSTECMTLEQFVSDGKFCKWRGKHEWEQWIDTYAVWCPEPDCHVHFKCKICGKSRGIKKTNKEVYEWED